jgi:hypothetical protein
MYSPNFQGLFWRCIMACLARGGARCYYRRGHAIDQATFIIATFLHAQAKSFEHFSACSFPTFDHVLPSNHVLSATTTTSSRRVLNATEQNSSTSPGND